MKKPPEDNLSLRHEDNPKRDVFTHPIRRDRGMHFLYIAGRISNLLEDMPDEQRWQLYMDEIPMGYKVLFDFKLILVVKAGKSPIKPDYRPTREFWSPPVGSYVVLYQSPLDFARSGDPHPQYRRIHYCSTQKEAIQDAESLAKKWGMHIAVCECRWSQNWH